MKAMRFPLVQVTKQLPKLGLFLIVGMNVHAASFDCAKAGTKVEHMICDNPEISKLDEELTKSYKAALQDKSKAGGVRQAQRQWLTNRNQCQDFYCVRSEYEGRLMQLVTCSATPSISAVSAHAAIRASDCSVWMWGFNNAGQLAKASKGIEKFAPVEGILPMVDVVVVHDHTIGITRNHQAYVWGEDEYPCPSDFPTHNPKLRLITGIPKVSKVDGYGGLTGLLTENGEVFQLGCISRNKYSGVSRPEKVEGLPRISALSIGGIYRLALSESGEVWSWTDGNPCSSGFVDRKGEIPTPTKITGLPKIVAVSTGSRHAMALDVNGKIWVWGTNHDWQLGIPESTCELSPVQLNGLPPIKAITTGWFESAALTIAGKVLLWGNRSLRGFIQPTEIANLDEVISVSLGGNAAVTSGVFVIKRNGDVLRWLPDQRSNYSIPIPTAPGKLSAFPEPSSPPFNVYTPQ